MKRSKLVLIPIQSNEFTIVKSENRLLTALCYGKDILYSYIPSYSFLLEFSEEVDENIFYFKFDGISKEDLLGIVNKYMLKEIGLSWKNIINQ